MLLLAAVRLLLGAEDHARGGEALQLGCDLLGRIARPLAAASALANAFISQTKASAGRQGVVEEAI